MKQVRKAGRCTRCVKRRHARARVIQHRAGGIRNKEWGPWDTEKDMMQEEFWRQN